MAKKLKAGKAELFNIPSDLVLDQADDCLNALREQIAAIGANGNVTVGITHGIPTQLALELLHSAGVSARAGSQILFSEEAQALIDMAELSSAEQGENQGRES